MADSEVGVWWAAEILNREIVEPFQEGNVWTVLASKELSMWIAGRRAFCDKKETSENNTTLGHHLTSFWLGFQFYIQIIRPSVADEESGI